MWDLKQEFCNIGLDTQHYSDSIFSNFRFFPPLRLLLICLKPIIMLLADLSFRMIWVIFFNKRTPESVSHIKCMWCAHSWAVLQTPETCLTYRENEPRLYQGQTQSSWSHWNWSRIHHCMFSIGCCQNPWKQGWLDLKYAWLLTTWAGSGTNHILNFLKCG